MDLLTYCKKESFRNLGVPILHSEIDDTMFEEEVINPVLVEYYTHAPYEYAFNYQITARGVMTILIPDPTTQTGWPNGVTAEYYGIVSLTFNSVPIFTGLSGNYAVDIDYVTQANLQATVVDMVSGDEIPQYDPVLKTLKVFAPSTGKMGLILGFALNTWRYVRRSHYIVFAKMVTKKLLELAISGRSSFIISSDLRIDPAAAQKKLDEVNQTYSDDVASITTPIMTWG